MFLHRTHTLASVFTRQPPSLCHDLLAVDVKQFCNLLHTQQPQGGRFNYHFEEDNNVLFRVGISGTLPRDTDP